MKVLVLLLASRTLAARLQSGVYDLNGLDDGQHSCPGNQEWRFFSAMCPGEPHPVCGDNQLKWYSSYSPSTYEGATAFCAAKGGRLATLDEMCHNDKVFEGIKQGDQWAPYVGGGDNEWAQVGTGDLGWKHHECKLHTPKHGKPAWGTDPSKRVFENWVLCAIPTPQPQNVICAMATTWKCACPVHLSWDAESNACVDTCPLPLPALPTPSPTPPPTPSPTTWADWDYSDKCKVPFAYWNSSFGAMHVDKIWVFKVEGRSGGHCVELGHDRDPRMDPLGWASQEECENSCIFFGGGNCRARSNRGISNPCYGHTCVSASAYQWLLPPLVVDKAITAVNHKNEEEESLRNPQAKCSSPGCGESMYPFTSAGTFFLKTVCRNSNKQQCCVYVEHGWGVKERTKRVCVDPSGDPTWSRIGVMRAPIRIRGSDSGVAMQDLWMGAEQPSDTWTCDGTKPKSSGNTWGPTPFPSPTSAPTGGGGGGGSVGGGSGTGGGGPTPSPIQSAPTPFPTFIAGPPRNDPPHRLHPCHAVPGGCPWYTGDACVNTRYTNDIVMPMATYGQNTGVFHEAESSCASPGCGSATYKGFVHKDRLWLRLVASDTDHSTIFIQPADSSATYQVDLPTCDQVVGAGNACGPYWVDVAKYSPGMADIGDFTIRGGDPEVTIHDMYLGALSPCNSGSYNPANPSHKPFCTQSAWRCASGYDDDDNGYPWRAPLTAHPTSAPTSTPTSYQGPFDSSIRFVKKTDTTIWGTIGFRSSTNSLHMSASNCVDRSNLCGAFGSSNLPAQSSHCHDQKSTSATIVNSVKFVSGSYIRLYSDGTLRFESPKCVTLHQNMPVSSVPTSPGECFTFKNGGGARVASICGSPGGQTKIYAHGLITL